MVRWNLLMRKVTMKGKIGRWKSTLDPEEGEFRILLKDMDKLQGIRYPRYVVPKEGQFGKPLVMMVFWDGSCEACCSLIRFRWERDDG
jgi:hypothetical protein